MPIAGSSVDTACLETITSFSSQFTHVPQNIFESDFKVSIDEVLLSVQVTRNGRFRESVSRF